MTGRIVITVAVLTYRRPVELRRCLPGVLAELRGLDVIAGVPVRAEALIVDNDPRGSAEAVVREFDDARLRYVVEAQPGIPFGRNRALDECAECDAVVFIDDDERPEDGWLERLVALWLLTAAAGVGGRVTSDFEVRPAGWVEAGRFFDRRSMPTGTIITVCATNNLLLDTEALRIRNLRFNETLGLGGGEDTLLTRQLSGGGGLLVWCEEAVVSEHVPAERVQRDWVMRRSWSHGNTLAKVELQLSDSGLRRVMRGTRLAGEGLARIVLGAVRTVAGTLVRRQSDQARGTRSVLRGAGMIAAVLGRHYHEYARRRVTTVIGSVPVAGRAGSESMT